MTQAGLELAILLPQPVKPLGLQAWNINSDLIFLLEWKHIFKVFLLSSWLLLLAPLSWNHRLEWVDVVLATATWSPSFPCPSDHHLHLQLKSETVAWSCCSLLFLLCHLTHGLSLTHPTTQPPSFPRLPLAGWPPWLQLHNTPPPPSSQATPKPSASSYTSPVLDRGL